MSAPPPAASLGADLFRLDGRVAVVTGASSGLGVALAEGLAAAGARVVLAARRRERLEAVAERIGRRGAQALAVEADVAQEAAVERLLARSLEHFGRVDVLVNNAGIQVSVPAEDESRESFERVIGVNLVGLFDCARHFGRAMLERGSGAIVNVASVLGLVASGQIPQASYVASKGGVVQLTRELAAQWARRGVRVNAIAPGWFHTEMTHEMFSDEAAHRWVRRRTPMGRAGEPVEVVGAALYLASDASSYVTGQVLTVDGGWTIV